MKFDDKLPLHKTILVYFSEKKKFYFNEIIRWKDFRRRFFLNTISVKKADFLT